jgi:hypothetical protein
MVNATEMAKVFDKDLFQFTKSDHAKSFIQSCLKPANAGLLDMKSENDLIVSRQKSGTFMHRILALKFAAWLNPDFEVWVYLTIDKLLFGKHAEREKSFERTIALQKEKENIINNPTRTVEDFNRYLEIENQLKRETAIRKSLTVESVCEMKDLFENQEI